MRQRVITLFIGLISHIYGITAQEIIKKVDEQEEYKTSKAVMVQTITTSSGESRSFTIQFYTSQKDAYMEYLEPARVRGIRMLFLNKGGEIWTYFPRTGRTRKIASHMKHQKVMGSDFSYEDYAGGEFEENYKSKLLGEEKEAGVNCYKLELIPTKSDVSYSKLITWIEKERFVLRRTDFYDEKGKPLKRLICSDYKQVNGYLTPGKFIMKNLKDKGETVMEVKEMEYDTKLPEGIFTVGRLGK